VTVVAPEEVAPQLGPPELEQGWFCIRTLPFPCPAEGCGYVAGFVTAAHRIVVWPNADDRVLLSVANDARGLGRDPRVVRYEQDFGPCVAFDAWTNAGRPVHGLIERPEGAPPYRPL